MTAPPDPAGLAAAALTREVRATGRALALGLAVLAVGVVLAVRGDRTYTGDDAGLEAATGFALAVLAVVALAASTVRLARRRRLRRFAAGADWARVRLTAVVARSGPFALTVVAVGSDETVRLAYPELPGRAAVRRAVQAGPDGWWTTDAEVVDYEAYNRNGARSHLVLTGTGRVLRVAHAVRPYTGPRVRAALAAAGVDVPARP